MKSRIRNIISIYFLFIFILSGCYAWADTNYDMPQANYMLFFTRDETPQGGYFIFFNFMLLIIVGILFINLFFYNLKLRYRLNYIQSKTAQFFMNRQERFLVSPVKIPAGEERSKQKPISFLSFKLEETGIYILKVLGEHESALAVSRISEKISKIWKKPVFYSGRNSTDLLYRIISWTGNKTEEMKRMSSFMDKKLYLYLPFIFDKKVFYNTPIVRAGVFGAILMEYFATRDPMDFHNLNLHNQETLKELQKFSQNINAPVIILLDQARREDRELFYSLDEKPNLKSLIRWKGDVEMTDLETH